MKTFLQEGLQNYAPALVAISEFRRQIRLKLQAVLNDFSRQFSDLGLSVTDLRPTGPKLDDGDLAENTSWIGLGKNYSADLSVGYEIQWDVDEPKDQRVWVEAWVYVGTRAERDRLFATLKQRKSPLSGTDLEQLPDGSPWLSAYCSSDLFCNFDDTFRSLIEEWLELISGAGGVKPFLSTTAISRLYGEAKIDVP